MFSKTSFIDFILWQTPATGAPPPPPPLNETVDDDDDAAATTTPLTIFDAAVTDAADADKDDIRIRRGKRRRRESTCNGEILKFLLSCIVEMTTADIYFMSKVKCVVSARSYPY